MRLRESILVVLDKTVIVPRGHPKSEPLLRFPIVLESRALKQGGGRALQDQVLIRLAIRVLAALEMKISTLMTSCEKT